jgi:tRNA G18 (ribose-2'-O)-methylase SpoU
MTEIFDINDNRIQEFRTLKKNNNQHFKVNNFIAEGEKVNLKLLKSNLNIIKFFAVSEFYVKNLELFNLNKIDDANIFHANKKLMCGIVGFKVHSGVMALAEIPKFQNINELSNRIVVLNSIVDSENVGSISRNCAAFGVDSLIFDNSTSSPYMRRAVRVSIGAVFQQKILYTQNLLKTLIELKELDYQIISAELNDNSIDYKGFSFPEKFCLIFGNESSGIDKSNLEISDYIIKIKISDVVDSINVAASSAVILSKINS